MREKRHVWPRLRRGKTSIGAGEFGDMSDARVQSGVWGRLPPASTARRWKVEAGFSYPIHGTPIQRHAVFWKRSLGNRRWLTSLDRIAVIKRGVGSASGATKGSAVISIRIPPKSGMRGGSRPVIHRRPGRRGGGRGAAKTCWPSGPMSKPRHGEVSGADEAKTEPPEGN